MNLFNPPLPGRNATFILPDFFIISGLSSLPGARHYCVFLLLVYLVSVVGNGAVMAVICLDRALRTPKYIAVFNLALVDLFGNTALVPKVLDIFLLGHPRVPYAQCLAFMFFCYTCLCMQSFNLVALSYDRLVAITRPLHYRARVTRRSMLQLVAWSWALACVAVSISVGLITRLSFCRSLLVDSYFCDHGQIYRLSCNDHFPSYVLSCLYPVLIFWLPLVFILLSYLSIGATLARVASPREGLKALKTCVGHVSLVAVYFVPLLITFTLMERIQPAARIINLSLTSVVPPALNPIVYVLQTQEIKESFRKLLLLRGRRRGGAGGGGATAKVAAM